MSGRKDPRRALKALSLLRMKDLWEDSALALKLKYMKMVTIKYLRSLSMPMKRHWPKRVPKKRNQRRIDSGSMASSSYLHTHPRVVLLTNIFLLGKIVKDYLRSKTSEAKSTFLTFYRTLISLNSLFNAANLKKYWLNLLPQAMLLLFGHKLSLTLQAKAIMENIPANIFNCKVENQECLFQFLMA